MARKDLFIAGEPWNEVEQLEIPLSNADGTAASSTKAKFIETTVEENAATAKDILSTKKAWVNGSKITGEIPSLTTTNYELKYTGLGIDKQPKQTISAGSYLAEDVTVTAPTYNDLTNLTHEDCPLLNSSSTTIDTIAEGEEYIRNGERFIGTLAETDHDYYQGTTLRSDAKQPNSFVVRTHLNNAVRVPATGAQYHVDLLTISIPSLQPKYIQNGVKLENVYTANGEAFEGTLQAPTVDWEDQAKGILSIS